MTQEKDIVHETSTHWVRRVCSGHYEVYQTGVCASTKVATVHFSNKPDSFALDRAKQECDRRSTTT